MNKIFQVLASTAVLVGLSSQAATVSRSANYKFVPAISYLKQGNLQYYYLMLLEKTQRQDPDDPLRLDESVFWDAVHLDESQDYQNRPAGQNFNIMITKIAVVVHKDISEFSPSLFGRVTFQRAVNPDVNLHYASDKKWGHYVGEGSALFPTSELQIQTYNRSQLSSVKRTGVNAVLSWDQSLGTPDVVMTEHFYNFGNVIFSKTSLSTRTVSKYYSVGKGQTLIVNYGISYIYSVLPGILGGTEKMRTVGETKAIEKRNLMENYRVPTN